MYCAYWSGRIIAQASSLSALINRLKDLFSPGELRIVRQRTNGDLDSVSRHRYAERRVPTREEALSFIHHRDELIKEGNHRAMMLDVHRCHYTDPTEQQIEEYIKTAPWIWKVKEYSNGTILA